MHPVSTLLFLAGYTLAVPIMLRISTVIGKQHRLAFTGHQIGVIIATGGWLLRGRFVVAAVHVGWLIAARLWFASGAQRPDPLA